MTGPTDPADAARRLRHVEKGAYCSAQIDPRGGDNARVGCPRRAEYQTQNGPRCAIHKGETA